jgi:hypothetical protein
MQRINALLRKLVGLPENTAKKQYTPRVKKPGWVYIIY